MRVSSSYFLVIVALAAALAASAHASLVEPDVQTADGTTTWTIMVYMAADVADELPWLQDINEMEAANQGEGTNVIVLLDPPDEGDTRLLRITQDAGGYDPDLVSEDIEDGGEVVPESGEVNTGSPDTLADFIEFSASSYPADNLVLVLWGHGAGWRGMCPDGFDLLTVPELRSGLLTAQNAMQRGIDMIVLDICDGATSELAFEVGDLADLLVGSEMGVPAEGLPYRDVLDVLAADVDQPLDSFGAAMVDAYVDWATYGSAYPVSASLLDLNAIGSVGERLDELSEFGIGFDRLFHDDFTAAIDQSEHCEEEWLADFGAMCRGFSSPLFPLEMSTEALSLGVAYSDTVLHHAVFSPDGSDLATTGMSLYAPSDEAEDSPYDDLRISSLTSWTDFSHMLREDRIPEESWPGPEVAVSDSADDNDDLPDSATVSWTETDSWNYTAFSVHVFRMEGAGLVECGTHTSSDPVMEISGEVGNLLLSASAYNGTEAYAHHTESVTLSRTVDINITIDRTIDMAEDGFVVSLSSPSGGTRSTECVGETCSFTVVTPDWADVGDLLRVELRAIDDGRLLSEKTVRVSGEDMDVVMLVFAQSGPVQGSGVVAPMLLLLIIVLGVATVLLANFVVNGRRGR